MPGYAVQVFDIRSTPNPSFVAPDGTRGTVKTTQPKFELHGRQINDPSPIAGPLFADMPVLRAVHRDAWDKVERIVIGAEGPGPNRWRTHFQPARVEQDQPLPLTLRERGGGWFFARLYDIKSRLIESLDFQFLEGLHDISVPRHPALPGPDGHQPIDVQIVHSEAVTIEVEDCQPRRVKGGTVVTLAPTVGNDSCECRISNGNATVRAKLSVDRIWWAIGAEGETPSDWKDKAIELVRGDFRATSSRALFVRFPTAVGGYHLFVGFAPATALRYPFPKSAERPLEIPLRDLGESLPANMSDAALRLWLKDVSANAESSVVATIVFKFKCTQCEFVAGQIQLVLKHAVTAHLSTFLALINDYDELIRALPELRNYPRYVHRCCKCNRLFPSDDNRPDRIFDHVCSKVQPHFEVVRNADRIRELPIMRDLPTAYRCWKGHVLKNPTRNDLAQHMLSEHRHDLYLELG